MDISVAKVFDTDKWVILNLCQVLIAPYILVSDLLQIIFTIDHLICSCDVKHMKLDVVSVLKNELLQKK